MKKYRKINWDDFDNFDNYDLEENDIPDGDIFFIINDGTEYNYLCAFLPDMSSVIYGINGTVNLKYVQFSKPKQPNYIKNSNKNNLVYINDILKIIGIKNKPLKLISDITIEDFKKNYHRFVMDINYIIKKYPKFINNY